MYLTIYNDSFLHLMCFSVPIYKINYFLQILYKSSIIWHIIAQKKSQEICTVNENSITLHRD